MCRERQECRETKVGVIAVTMRDGDAEAPESQIWEKELDEQIRWRIKYEESDSWDREGMELIF